MGRWYRIDTSGVGPDVEVTGAEVLEKATILYGAVEAPKRLAAAKMYPTTYNLTHEAFIYVWVWAPVNKPA